MKIITKRKAVSIIKSAKESGRFFKVTFIKRSDGSVREMVSRGGVVAHLKGGELKYSPEEKNLVVVFDAQKKAYRTINLNNILNVTAEGVEYQIKQKTRL